MAVNMLKYSSLSNAQLFSGLPQRSLSRLEMKSLLGFATSSGVLVPSLTYVGLEANLPRSFFCKDSSFVITNGSDSLWQVSCQVKQQANEAWQDVLVTHSGGKFFVNFNYNWPDMSQLVCGIRFTYVNLAATNSILCTWDLLSVDYPIDFDYTEFNIAASSCGNAPISVGNHAIQGDSRDIRVMPIYSGDYTLDRTFVMTASGKEDSDIYHVDRGIRFPEDVPWDSGFYSNTMVSGRYLTLSGTATSGSWISPAIYISDPNYMSLYVYTENDGDYSGLEKNWLNINEVLEARASDETPLPNFLINQWTYRLHTMPDLYGNMQSMTLPTRARRHVEQTLQTGYYPTDDYWVRDMEPCNLRVEIETPCPYLFGRSDRIYMKGDGTIIASNPTDRYQIAARDYWTGIPYKVYGAINKYWNAGTFIGMLGEGFATGALSAETLYNRLTYATPNNTSDWNAGRDVGTLKFSQIYPFKSYGCFGALGVAQRPVYFDYLGATTLPKPQHPNEWIVVVAVQAPCEVGADKYMCIYLLNVRNWWTSECKLLGIYGIGEQGTDEGYAVCNCSDADENEGGFWLHVGYSSNIIAKFTGDGYQVQSYTVSRGYNSLKESPEAGCLWAVRNDGVFYYKENTSGDTATLDVQFKIESEEFTYIQAGDVDAAGNLWFVDRDSATVYRINLANREVDFTQHVPYAVAVWPHPTDGSAFVYVSFDEDSFTTSIKRVSIYDTYGITELVTDVPSMPLSDWSGVQFTGKLSGTYISPGVSDPVFGNDDRVSLAWQPYVNTGLTIPAGNYKQFRLTLRRNSVATDSPRIVKARIPLPLVLGSIPFHGSQPFYINPHLRYDVKSGDFSMDLLTWWEH
jgi:hypothetical protein